ncbi:Phage-related protein [Paenibacillus polymyxa]|uniref:phage distal tail protein n=1 Tax=Paenibacillus polymyxa TaxID=1406 RepID=UPI000D96BF97|nr:phage tail domain-containing protein [Paenibacillus polymyxa]SPY16903.1 Phage-related protein [Paenibacillus polymyxa]
MFNTTGFNNLALNSGSSADGNVIDLSAHLSGQGQMYSRRKEVIGADAGNAFNLMAFNTPDSSVSIEYILDFNLDMTAGAELSGEGRAQSDFVRSYDLEAVPMSGDGRMSNADYVREILLRAVPMSGEGRLQADASRYHTDYIELVGSFAPGDRIIIDSKNLKITKNGQNALHEMQGNFFDLNLGNNVLSWTDPETGRDILFRITYRDRFV